MDYIVSSGQVSNGLVISEGDSLEVTGGVVNDTVMNEGDAYIYDGGKANATIVNGHFDEDREDWYYGRLRVSAGGVANDTKLNGGDLYVYEDGTANDTAVNAGGYFGVYDGGETNRAVVNAKGAFYVEDGGVANDTVVSGYYDEEYGDWERGGVYVEGGGTANTISVNAGGELYVEYGGSAGDVIISAGGILDGFGWSEDRHFDSIEDGIVQVADGVSIEDRYMTVSSGGVANDTTVYGYDYYEYGYRGELYIEDGGVANNTALAGGCLYVEDGGVANDTTLLGGYHWGEYEDAMTVSSGGVANGITVNAGQVYIKDGGVANAITVNAGGRLYGYGEATEVTENGGYVDDEGLNVTFVAHTFSGVVLEGTKATVHSGTIANNTTVTGIYDAEYDYWEEYGELDVYAGGVANNTTVDAGGELYVYDGGVANDTTVDGGTLRVEEGGTLNGTIVKSGSNLEIETGAEVNNTTLDGGYLCVNYDITVNAITVNAGGELYVENGAEAADIAENGGYVEFDDDATVTFVAHTFSDVVLAGTCATVHSGTIANNTTVCGLYDAEEDYWEEYGELYVYDGGVASNTTVDAGGELHVDEGGKLTGTLTIAEDAYVYMDPYSFLDFDISVVSPDNAALLNDWSLLGSTPEYTITTSMTQAAGVYALAGGAEDFYECITVNTTDGDELGEIEVDGDELITEKYIYTLGITEGTLSLTVRFADTEPPVKPAAIADITTSTNKDITITAAFSDDSVVREYSLDGETWSAYTTGTVFKENGTIYFRAADEAGNVSEVTEFVISNIDRIPPAKPTATADITAATNRDVTVTAAFSDDSAVKEYSLDGETWSDYTTGVVLSDNGTVYFRAADEAGNVSEVTEYEVANIDKVAPDAPVAAANITAKTTGKVTVAATFSADSAQKQYSTDQKTWQAYTSGVVFTENGTVYFRGTDEAGNISDVTSYTVSNIIADTFTTESTVAPGAEAAFTPKLEAAGLYTVNGTFKGAKGSVTVVDKTGKKVGSGSVKNGVITFKNALLLDNSNSYKVVVKNTDKKGGTSAYTVELKAKELFLKGDTTDNTLKGARTLAAGTTANDWVGYGDAVDYYKLGVNTAGGIYDLSLSGVKNNVKLTVYSKSGAKVKTVTASAAKPNIPLAGLCLDSGSYAVIEAPKAAKAQNSDYALKLTEKATFNWKNNDWNGATVLTTADAPFAGALTKAAGGDVVDYCDVSALGNLSFKTTAGKVKVSFFDTNKQAVKVAIKAGGKDKTAAAVSLTSGKVDNFTIGTLPSSVKYLKIEATGKTLNSYSIGKLA